MGEAAFLVRDERDVECRSHTGVWVGKESGEGLEGVRCRMSLAILFSELLVDETCCEMRVE